MLSPRRELDLVVARVHIRRQVPDVGDVDDVNDVLTLPLEHTSQPVSEDVGAQVPDVLIGVDRRPTRIDACSSGLERLE
jgi:hypothetical protein